MLTWLTRLMKVLGATLEEYRVTLVLWKEVAAAIIPLGKGQSNGDSTLGILLREAPCKKYGLSCTRPWAWYLEHFPLPCHVDCKQRTFRV